MPDFTTSPGLMIMVALLSYLLGSVPFGLVITRMLGLGDLRQIGSGNIGATNVLRTGSKGAAGATLILDAAKGALAVLVARTLVGEDAAQLAGLSSFLGHRVPIWLRFRGGKGVATFLGILLALDWRVGVACCAVWALTAAVSRISSLAALIAAALSTLWLLVFRDGQMMALVILLTLLIYVRHWANLERIKKGTEPRIGRKPVEN